MTDNRKEFEAAAAIVEDYANRLLDVPVLQPVKHHLRIVAERLMLAHPTPSASTEATVADTRMVMDQVRDLLQEFGRAAIDYSFAKDVKANQEAKRRWDKKHDAILALVQQLTPLPRPAVAQRELERATSAALISDLRHFVDRGPVMRGEEGGLSADRIEALATCGLLERVGAAVFYQPTTIGKALLAQPSPPDPQPAKDEGREVVVPLGQIKALALPPHEYFDSGWQCTAFRCRQCGFRWMPDNTAGQHRDEEHAENCAYVIARDALDRQQRAQPQQAQQAQDEGREVVVPRSALVFALGCLDGRMQDLEGNDLYAADYQVAEESSKALHEALIRQERAQPTGAPEAKASSPLQERGAEIVKVRIEVIPV